MGVGWWARWWVGVGESWVRARASSVLQTSMHVPPQLLLMSPRGTMLSYKDTAASKKAARAGALGVSIVSWSRHKFSHQLLRQLHAGHPAHRAEVRPVGPSHGLVAAHGL